VTDDARGGDTDPAALLARDPVLGRAVVFDTLAAGPRIKPSRALLIDPADEVWQRWQQRVAAAAALLSDPAVAPVVDELIDELAESREFAQDVAAVANPWDGLTATQRAALARLAGWVGPTASTGFAPARTGQTRDID
jgi:hypothetical protein